MRKFILPALLFMMLAGCDEKKSGSSFNITGTIKNSQSRMIYFEQTDIAAGRKIMKDSVDIGEDGKFNVKIKADGEGVYNIRMVNDPSPFASIINDASTITVDADFSKTSEFYDVKGSPASQSIKDYLAKIGETQREKFNYLAKADSIKAGKGDSALADSYSDKAKEVSAELKTFSYTRIVEAKGPSLALFTLATYQSLAQNPYYRMDVFNEEETIALLNDMLSKYPERTDIAGIRNTIESQMARSVWVGKDAPEIDLPDTEGRNVSLSSFRGKYVLVDFWASWCRPCRDENPNVVDAYNRFRNKNFTVLGVSLDANKDAWQKAIVKDNLNWTHISDLKQWQSIVVPMYKIGGIPFNVLVNPDGKVIAENLRGSALEQKLKQVLN